MKFTNVTLLLLIAVICTNIVNHQSVFASTPNKLANKTQSLSNQNKNEASAKVYFSSKPFVGKGAGGASNPANFKAGNDIYCRVVFNQPLSKVFEDYDEDERIVIFFLYQLPENGEKRRLEQSVKIKMASSLINQNYLDVDLMPAPEKAVTNESWRLSDVLAADRYASTNMEERKQVGKIRRFSLNVGIGRENTKKAGAGELQVDYTAASIKSLKDWYERDKAAYAAAKAKTEQGNVTEAMTSVKKLPLPKVFLTPYATGAGTISYKEISNEQIISMLEQKHQSKIYMFRFIKPQSPEDFVLSYRSEEVVGKVGKKFFFYIFKDAETGACKASPGTLRMRHLGGGNYGELTIEDFFIDVAKYIEDVYPKDQNGYYYVDCDKVK